LVNVFVAVGVRVEVAVNVIVAVGVRVAVGGVFTTVKLIVKVPLAAPLALTPEKVVAERVCCPTDGVQGL
jgi:hypothetical protein